MLSQCVMTKECLHEAYSPKKFFQDGGGGGLTGHYSQCLGCGTTKYDPLYRICRECGSEFKPEHMYMFHCLSCCAYDQEEAYDHQDTHPV